MNKALFGRVVRREDLTAADIGEQYELFHRHYHAVDRARFEQDLEQKHHVLVLTDEDGKLRGFTTIRVDDWVHEGRPLRTVFSGNTVIDQAYWGSQELGRTWCRFMAGLKNSSPELPLYWHLICSGYRTYLYLPLFFREFYPRIDRATPPDRASLIDALGRRTSPEEYRNGVVRVTRPRDRLRGELAVPPSRKRLNPHVRFFLERNPGYRRGDELVCLAEFAWGNLRRRTLRLLESTARRSG